jgi:TRAP-type C4-dicarboxylate transport system permease small subunit
MQSTPTALDRCAEKLARLYRHLGAALTIALMALVFGNIVLREILGVSLVWANELSLVLFVWIVFVGAGLAFASGGRIRFTLLTDLVWLRGRAWVEVAISYAGFAILLGFWVMSIYMAWTFRNQRFTSMDATVMWEWGAAPVGIALALLGWVRHGVWRPGAYGNRAMTGAATSL